MARSVPPRLPAALTHSRLVEFAQQTFWYHTLELSPGVTTSATYDHRDYVRRYGFPEDMTGWTVLDVGTADGFCAFEFERRGGRCWLLTLTDSMVQ